MGFYELSIALGEPCNFFAFFWASLSLRRRLQGAIVFGAVVAQLVRASAYCAGDLGFESVRCQSCFFGSWHLFC
jgi:hypothetical protein